MKKRDKVKLICYISYLVVLLISCGVSLSISYEAFSTVMLWHNPILIVLMWIFIFSLEKSYENEIKKLDQERRELAKIVYEKLSTNSSQENLKQAIKEIEVAIDRYQSTLDNKKYCGEHQRKNIQTKLEKAQKHKKMLEEKLIYGNKKKGEASVKVAAPAEKTNDFKQKQLLICNEIEKIMKNQFANVTYSIKKSESTSSVYLSFINSHNINKTIRFSDHGSSKNIRQYSEKVVFSNKAMVRIIESNLKSLSKKTVIVLLKQLKGDRV